MKKQIVVLLCFCMALSLLTVCCGKAESNNTPDVPTEAPTDAPAVTVPTDKDEELTLAGKWVSEDEQTVVPLTLHLYTDGTLVLECHENKAGTWTEGDGSTYNIMIDEEPYTILYAEATKMHGVRIRERIGEEEISVQLSEVKDTGTVAEDNNRALIERLEKSFASETVTDIPVGAVVFYGGSNFSKWTSLEQDFAGYPVVNRSIGGSNDPIREHFFAERVAALQPSIVLYMSSSNDWTSGQSKEDIIAYKGQLFDEMHAALPDTVFIILSATPNPLRYFGEYHDGMVEVDAFTEGYCKEHEMFHFLNVVPALSKDDGAASNDAIWQSDRLHLNEDGYAILTELVRGAIDEAAAAHGITLAESLGIEEDGDEQKTSWTKDWTTFESWTEEDFSIKEIAYQLTGTWSMDGDYPMTFHLLMNLYRDGSTVVYQHSPTRDDFHYYGYWTERDLEKGHRLSITMRFESSDTGLVEHPYTYRIYPKADGGYSFSFDFNIIPGAYQRAAELSGSADVKYTAEAEFASAMDLQ